MVQTRVWVTDPTAHPHRVEWLRYAPDSPVDPAFQRSPHVAYTVDDLEAAIGGKEVVLGPFAPGDGQFARVAFTREDGLIVEYMQVSEGRRWLDDGVDGSGERA